MKRNGGLCPCCFVHPEGLFPAVILLPVDSKSEVGKFFSVKSQILDIFNCASHAVSVAMAQLCRCRGREAVGKR